MDIDSLVMIHVIDKPLEIFTSNTVDYISRGWFVCLVPTKPYNSNVEGSLSHFLIGNDCHIPPSLMGCSTFLNGMLLTKVWYTDVIYDNVANVILVRCVLKRGRRP